MDSPSNQTVVSKPPYNQLGRWVNLFLAPILGAGTVWFVWFSITDNRAHSFNDDGYITLTFARNFAESGLLRYHPTFPLTLGSTSPLYTILLGILIRLLPMARAETLLFALAAAFRIGCAWLWFLKGKSLRLGHMERFVVAWLILFNMQNWIDMVSMESNFFVFMLSLSIFLFAERRFLVAGIFGALLFLSRGEGILILPIFGLWRLGEIFLSPEQRRKIREAIADCLKLVIGATPILTLWAIYALSTMGVLLPNTVGAKMVQTSIGWPSFADNLPKLFTDIWTSLQYKFNGQIISGWAVCAVFGLIIVVFWRRRVLILGLWGVGFCLGYMLLRPPHQIWYYLPAVFVVTIFAGVGIGALLGLLEELFRQPTRTRSVLQVFTGLLVLATVAGVTAEVGIDSPAVVKRSREFNDNQPVADYLRISDWLVKNTPVNARVAYVEIGFIAWFSDRPVLDMLALTNPEFLPDIARNDFVAVFEKANPDYFIYMDMYPFLNPILSSDVFISNYFPVARLDAVTTVRINHPYTIYRRGKANAPMQTARDIAITFTPQDGQNALTNMQQTSDGLRVHPDNDPYIWKQPVSYCAADFDYIAVTLSASADITGDDRQLEFYFATDETKQFNAEQRYMIALRRDAQMQQYIIPTSLLSRWQGRITGVRVDPVRNGTKPESSVTIKELRLVRNAGETHCK